MLLLFATPAAADHGAAATSFLDYFLGDFFHIPGPHMGPKAPLFRPWRIFNVSGGGTLAFDCAGDVPTLHLLPHSDHPDQGAVNTSSNAGTLPPATCGGGGAPEAGTTPVQYKFSRRDKPAAGYSAMFWAQPAAGAGDGDDGGEKENGASASAPLMPLPKLQLKAILKFVAAAMDAAWRGEKGEAAVPEESVAFPADTVAFYVKGAGWLVVMGREDVKFHKPWKRLDGKFRDLTVGAL